METIQDKKLLHYASVKINASVGDTLAIAQVRLTLICKRDSGTYEIA